MLGRLISNGTGFRARKLAARLRFAGLRHQATAEANTAGIALFMRLDWRRLDRCARLSGPPRTVRRRRELVGLRSGRRPDAMVAPSFTGAAQGRLPN